MRFQYLLGYGAVLALCQLVSASPLGNPDEPEVVVFAEFPEDNAFGHVVNGQRNDIFVTVENKSDRNVTLQNIAGSLHHTDTNKLVKNTTASTYKLPLLEGAKLKLPYSFYSEFKPGDLRLNLWVEHETDGEKYRVVAYDSIIKIVEPEGSFFDIKMWITYAIVLGLLGGAGYFSYLTFVPQPKKRKVPTPSAPVGTVTATGAGGYQEEWIPEHHLKKPKARKTKSGAVTSGDETSGAELSAAEGRKRKGKK
ncbi:hypothetical protein PHLGIDRAFT_83972 [Phlebiopsis gigantea 11061_1 CR5-6]|uniref:Translocon-associated protein subunit alpha n=1 Tax=Phlebiopsis gigantea (strain 11061_1 CR5-6) TaxID=745531 RepID=A0A0C3S5B2_PHLG1|nr:hypothetical protein PHLGIDRAFT_83972 [Phlebiopsis gigantea 11061_1 CR5-6]